MPLDVGSVVVSKLSFTGIGSPCNAAHAITLPSGRQYLIRIQRDERVQSPQALCTVKQ